MIGISKKKPAISFPPIQLIGQNVFLRPPRLSDHENWSQTRRRCREYLQPYEPLWTLESLTVQGFERRLTRQSAEWGCGQANAFLIFRRDDNRLIGGMNINNISRGAAQYCTLGYWLDEAEQGRGFMHQAIMLTIKYCFESLQLHRINASTLPHNERSKNVLIKAGFIREGFAKHYLQINGQWQDHELYGLPIESWGN